MNRRHIFLLVSVALNLFIACEPSPAQREKQLCRTWTVETASFTDRSEYIAFTKQRVAEMAQKGGLSPYSTREAIQSVESRVNDAMLASLRGSRMKFTPDYNVALYPPGQAAQPGFGTWLLKDQALTITAAGIAETTEVVSLSNTQLVLEVMASRRPTLRRISSLSAGAAQQFVAGERGIASFSTSIVRRGLRAVARAT